MARLSAKERAKLPNSAFAYVDSHGQRRLPINDESHVRNALARFDQVSYETSAARENARSRLLRAAQRHGIMPVGFITSQLRSEGTRAGADRPIDRPSLPTGLVTLLLTDIEGSSGLLQRLGERYEVPLENTRRIVRQSVLQAGGREVDVVADETFSVFEDPAGAIQAAVDIQRTMSNMDWPDDLVVRVRAGIHSGTVKLTSIGYIGLAIHKAARVCSAAHGGQIVASDETRAAVEASGPAEVRFRSLGLHKLAGLPKTHRLFELEADGLATDFPKLRTGVAETKY